MYFGLGVVLLDEKFCGSIDVDWLDHRFQVALRYIGRLSAGPGQSMNMKQKLAIGAVIVFFIVGIVLIEPRRWEQCRAEGRSWFVCALNTLSH